MPIVTARDPGTFCWPELYTTDPVAAKEFYTRLLGWEIREIPMGPDAAYTIFTVGGHDAAACYGAMPDMEAQGIPSRWISYVAVASADETSARAREAGGAVLKEPFDVPSIGRMAVVQDPTGAAVCLWQARGHIGIGIERERGALQWTELHTHDTEGAAAFYARLLGWERRLWPSPAEAAYHLFAIGETVACGMTPIVPEMAAMPSVWVVYFNVESCEKAIALAHHLGGHVTMPPETVEGVGTFAFLADPTGAHFGILQPA